MTMPKMTADDFDDEPQTMSDLMRAEASRIRTRSDIAAAATSTPGRQRMAELQKAYNAAIRQVRNDPNLSTRGKQQAMSRAYTNVRREMTKLAEADRKTHIERHDQLERELFGNASKLSGADAVSHRDAADRAAKLDNPEAARLALGTAHMRGDAVLAQAIAMHAWQASHTDPTPEGWNSVVESYAIDNPGVTDQLAELGAIRHTLTSNVSTIGQGLVTDVSMPDEIRALGASDISRYAKDDPQPSRKGLEEMDAAHMVGVTNGAAGLPTHNELNRYSDSVRAELAEAGE